MYCIVICFITIGDTNLEANVYCFFKPMQNKTLSLSLWGCLTPGSSASHDFVK